MLKRCVKNYLILSEHHGGPEENRRSLKREVENQRREERKSRGNTREASGLIVARTVSPTVLVRIE